MLSIKRLFSSRRDDLVLGRFGKGRFSQKFSISQKVRKFHSYVVGLTGRGKSKFLQNCILQDIQAEVGYLPKEVLQETSAGLGVPLSRVYSVVTFFKAFSLPLADSPGPLPCEQRCETVAPGGAVVAV